jgi:hypothetical protein
MFTSGNQRTGLAEETHHHDDARNEMGRSPEGTCALAVESKMRMNFEPHGDIMFVDLCDAAPGDYVEVIDVGDQIGFPGQVQVRVNREKGILYGMTIQNFSAFKRRLFWKYKMASVHHALLFLLISLRAGLRMEHTQPTAAAW